MIDTNNHDRIGQIGTGMLLTAWILSKSEAAQARAGGAANTVNYTTGGASQ